MKERARVQQDDAVVPLRRLRDIAAAIGLTLLSLMSSNTLAATKPTATAPEVPRPVSSPATMDTTETGAGADSPRLKVFVDLENQAQHLGLLIRSGIGFVDFVSERGKSDVQVDVRSRALGADRSVWTLLFLGRRRFAGANDTLVVRTGMKAEQERDYGEIVRWLNLGLVKYALHTPLARDLSLQFVPSLAHAKPEDSYNPWTCSLGGSLMASGASRQSALMLLGSLSMRRTTAHSKLGLQIDGDMNQQRFSATGQDGADIDISGLSRRMEARCHWIRDLGRNFAIGWLAAWRSDQYENVWSEVRTGPGLEYNFFSYEEAPLHECRILYQIGLLDVSYREPTVFGRLGESLRWQSLTLSLAERRPWGWINAALQAGSYLHDPRLNRLNAEIGLTLSLGRGISISTNSTLARIHDQLNLPAGDLTAEDLIMQRRVASTSYSYATSIGLNLNFGSGEVGAINSRFGI